MSPDPLTPGTHTFHSPSKDLTFEYIIQTNDTLEPPSHHNLIIIHPPAWGLGSSYLQHGLHELLTSSPSPSPSSSYPNKNTYTLLYHHPRGTGHSTRPLSQKNMSSFELATDLEDLRIHLNLDKIPTLLGHSNGGAIALAYAELFPGRVERLVLVDGQLIGFKGIRGKEREEEKREYRDEDNDTDQDGNEYANDNDSQNSDEKPTDEDNQHHSHGDINTNMLKNCSSSTKQLKLDKASDLAFTASVNAMWPLYFSNPTAHVPVLLSAIGNHVMPVWCYEGVYGSDRVYEESGEMVSRLGDVKARTLIIAGAEDHACRLQSAERMRDGIAGNRLVVFKGCGHFPWIEARERTLNEIKGFVEET